MDKKFSLEKIPFYNLKKINDSCPRFTVITSLEKYPKIIKELQDLQKILKAENIFYQNKFYLEVKESEKKKPIGWDKFLKNSFRRENIDIEFEIDNIRISGRTKKKYINFKLTAIRFSKF